MTETISARPSGERPILFSGPMVQALLAGRKTQTRRLAALPEPSGPLIDMVKVATDSEGRPVYEMKDGGGKHVTIRAGKHSVTPQFVPRFAVGDRLYVREHWRTIAALDAVAPRDIERGTLVSYEADYDAEPNDGCRGRFRQGMHMPRWASRLTLTVTDVRVQRLHEIDIQDCRAEGCEIREFSLFGSDAYMRNEIGRLHYRQVWEDINGVASWKANPWVVAVSFSVERRNIDARTP